MMSKLSLFRLIAALITGLFSILAILYVLTPPVWNLKEGVIRVTRWPRDGETIYWLNDKHPHWTPIEIVSRHTLHAIITAEDARFYNHNGLDYVEIEKSFKLNMEKGGYIRGASTITQQVVKMGFLSSEKSIFRKIQEAIGALLVEKILSKEEILEWYINLAEFGDGVFGIRQAAQHYFKTAPELLTIQQSTHLALVLPSPNLWSKGLRQKKLTEFGHERFRHIIERMHREGYITETLMQRALETGDFGRSINSAPPDPNFVETENTKN